jgi:hypothetical protein
LFWVLLAVYVEWNKSKLLEKARTEIDTRIGGTLQVGHLDISLFRHFPSVTVAMSDVSLRDSLWGQHHHDLLTASHIFISGSIFKSLFSGKVELTTVFVEHGSVYFYTDSTGYSNTYLLKEREAAGRETASGRPADSGKEPGLPELVCSDVRFVVDIRDRHKLFDLDFRRLHAVIRREDRVLRFDVHTDLTARSFAFNTAKGSFVKDKPISGRFAFNYNTASHILQVADANLEIDGHPFVFSGRFFPTVKPDPFFLTIHSSSIRFREAAGLLTPLLQQKLDQYDIDQPLAVHVQLDAGAEDQHEPQLQIRLNAANAGVLTPTGRFNEVSFLGFFTNEWVRGQVRGDENSGIRFTNFAGNIEGIPLHADSIEITDLTRPQLSCGLKSQFDLSALNDVYGSQLLQFKKGSCRLDLRYKGPLSEDDTAGATVNGRLDIDSGTVLYAPHPFQLVNATGRLLFRDQDLVIERLDARAGNTRLQIKGVAKNLIALLDHNSENVTMDWNLSAAHLALEDFQSLVGRSSGAGGQAAGGRSSGAIGQSTGGPGRRSGGAVFGTTANRVDNFLKDGLIHVNLDANNISYADFSGAHARAELFFQPGEIRLKRLNVEQNSGSLDMQAVLTRNANRNSNDDANPLSLVSHLKGVDLPGLFRSFDDFGLKGLSAHNLKGRMDADIQLSGLLTNKARIVPNSMHGRVNFRIDDGQLIDFEPMEKIHETVLKKRDMSVVRFAALENSLDLDSSTIKLHRMEIQSTAFTIYAEGTYDLKTGADMSLQVPLSNLKTRAGDIPPESRGNDSKGGISLHLRAKTGEDGKLKVTWDPFRKALKKAKKA